MKEEIEKVREEINEVMSSDHIDYDRALSISQKMDKLILEYYRKRVLE
ncbi:aspartyl-phosphate phosphatase Spo0E family protein [Clostridium thermosuccinogenes]|mgnify:CR=1 FL=1|nr:aspartyl-phosphate phosphatase Spo0E family protein [Pseudoclostridium thermosuccinogenes]